MATEGKAAKAPAKKVKKGWWKRFHQGISRHHGGVIIALMMVILILIVFPHSYREETRRGWMWFIGAFSQHEEEITAGIDGGRDAEVVLPTTPREPQLEPSASALVPATVSPEWRGELSDREVRDILEIYFPIDPSRGASVTVYKVPSLACVEAFLANDHTDKEDSDLPNATWALGGKLSSGEWHWAPVGILRDTSHGYGNDDYTVIVICEGGKVIGINPLTDQIRDFTAYPPGSGPGLESRFSEQPFAFII
jgi:hypothetical protein